MKLTYPDVDMRDIPNNVVLVVHHRQGSYSLVVHELESIGNGLIATVFNINKTHSAMTAMENSLDRNNLLRAQIKISQA